MFCVSFIFCWIWWFSPRVSCFFLFHFLSLPISHLFSCSPVFHLSLSPCVFKPEFLFALCQFICCCHVSPVPVLCPCVRPVPRVPSASVLCRLTGFVNCLTTKCLDFPVSCVFLTSTFCCWISTLGSCIIWVWIFSCMPAWVFHIWVPICLKLTQSDNRFMRPIF